MSWYSIANEEVNLTIQEVMKKNHGDLHAEGVTITALIARSEEGPAIKVRGCEAAGCIRITGLAERTMGIGDAVMTLDGERLDSWSSRRLQAVIDHELRHLVLSKSKKTGAVQRDDPDRPKLKIRMHDVEFGWFARTAELYGDDSYEVAQVREIGAAAWVQHFLPGLETDPDEETTTEFLSRQRKKIAAEREKVQAALDSIATSQRTAALSSKAAKPKRASKKQMAVVS